MAQRPDDAGVVSVNGFGFPKPEGGPVCRVRKRKLTALENDIDRLASLYGSGVMRGNLEFLREGKN